MDNLRGPGMWWSGNEGRVVPGAPCSRLVLSQEHELLLRGRRACAHLPCQDGEGAWERSWRARQHTLCGNCTMYDTMVVAGCVTWEPDSGLV